MSANIGMVLLQIVLAGALGIAPGSSAFQPDADLSQLNVHKNGEAERTRTVIVFIDNEVHTPFCHGLWKWWMESGEWTKNWDLNTFTARNSPLKLRLFSCQTSKKERLRPVSPWNRCNRSLKRENFLFRFREREHRSRKIKYLVQNDSFRSVSGFDRRRRGSNMHTDPNRLLTALDQR